MEEIVDLEEYSKSSSSEKRDFKKEAERETITKSAVENILEAFDKIDETLQKDIFVLLKEITNRK